MAPRDHFLPFRRDAILEMCLDEPGLDDQGTEQFRTLAKLLGAVYHFEFHDRLRALDAAYAPFDPDRDTRGGSPPTPAERSKLRDQLVEGLEVVLAKGNYVRIGEAELEHALAAESLFRIRLHIDFDDLEEFLFYRRGESIKRETLTKLWGLRKREIDVPTYERVLMFVVFKDAAWFAAKKKKDLPFQPGSTMLKLFANIPRADLEMLFPNSEVRMKTIDKVAMGVPALVTGAIVVVTKLAAVVGLLGSLILFWLGLAEDRPVIDSARLVALGGGLAAFGAYAAKQWISYKNRKIRFMKALTDNLYFKNLANNRSVLGALVDRAEGEEVKESLLAYRFLLAGPLDLRALDEAVETWLREQHAADVDFDASDALDKLDRLGLATRDGERWRATPLPDALRRLDQDWDAHFDF